MAIMDQIVVLAKKGNLQEILNFIGNKLKSVEYNTTARLHLELSVEEAYVNIANYAYGSESGKVLIRCRVDENPLHVTVQFIDCGIPFNPLEKEDPDTSLEIEGKKIGGMGILLIKKYADQVDYEYRDKKNILTIKKRLHGGSLKKT